MPLLFFKIYNIIGHFKLSFFPIRIYHSCKIYYKDQFRYDNHSTLPEECKAVNIHTIHHKQMNIIV